MQERIKLYKKEPTFNRLEGGLEVGIIGQKLCEPYNY
jgi:hypothetical protein